MTHAVDIREQTLADVQSQLKMKEGFDVGLEMSGAPQAFGSMLNNMVMGGKIAMLGLPSKPIEVDFGQLVLKAITLKGVYGREMFETWYKMIAMLESGLDVSRIITHRYAADEFQKGFDAMRAGKSGKVVLDWS